MWQSDQSVSNNADIDGTQIETDVLQKTGSLVTLVTESGMKKIENMSVILTKQLYLSTGF